MQFDDAAAAYLQEREREIRMTKCRIILEGSGKKLQSEVLQAEADIIVVVASLSILSYPRKNTL